MIFDLILYHEDVKDMDILLQYYIITSDIWYYISTNFLIWIWYYIQPPDNKCSTTSADPIRNNESVGFTQSFFLWSKAEYREKSTAFKKENNKIREEQSLFHFHCNCHNLNCWVCKGLASPHFFKTPSWLVMA